MRNVLAFRQSQPEATDRVEILREITGINTGDRVHDTLEASGLAPRSNRIYRRAINRFESWLGAELESMSDEAFDALLGKYAV